MVKANCHEHLRHARGSPDQQTVMTVIFHHIFCDPHLNTARRYLDFSGIICLAALSAREFMSLCLRARCLHGFHFDSTSSDSMQVACDQLWQTPHNSMLFRVWSPQWPAPGTTSVLFSSCPLEAFFKKKKQRYRVNLMDKGYSF